MILRRNAAGDYVTSARLDSIFEVNIGSFESFESFELFELTEDRKVLIDSRRTANGTRHVSWVETAIDTWSYVQPIENLRRAFNVHEGQLFISDGGTNSIRVYELDAEARNWVQMQTLNFNEPGAGNRLLRTGIQPEGNRLNVMSSLGDTGAIASLFVQDEANHPVYGWMGWIAVNNPTNKTLLSLRPAVDAAYEKAVKNFEKRVQN